MGAPEAARPAFAESLALARALGYREVLANCVEGAAELALDGGDPALAAALLAAARRMMDEIGVRLQGIEAEAFAELEAALGAEAVAAVAALTDDDAVTRAIEVLERPLTRPRPG